MLSIVSDFLTLSLYIPIKHILPPAKSIKKDLQARARALIRQTHTPNLEISTLKLCPKPPLVACSKPSASQTTNIPLKARFYFVCTLPSRARVQVDCCRRRRRRHHRRRARACVRNRFDIIIIIVVASSSLSAQLRRRSLPYKTMFSSFMRRTPVRLPFSCVYTFTRVGLSKHARESTPDKHYARVY